MTSENFSATAPKGSSKFPVKALVHVIGRHLVFPVAVEYVICYLLTGVISNTLFHAAFNRPVTALGVMAAGMLVRNFTRQKVQQPSGQLLQMPMLTPAELANFREALDSEFPSAADAAPKASPYL